MSVFGSARTTPIRFPRSRHTSRHTSAQADAQPRVAAEVRPSAPPLAPNSVRRLVDVRGAAAYLSVSPDTVEGLLQRGVIRRVTLPGVRRLLVDLRELDRLVAGRDA